MTGWSIGGLAREFFGRVFQYYRDTYGPDSPQVRDCHQAYRFEPHMAEARCGAAEWLRLFWGDKAPPVVPGEGPLTWGQAAAWLRQRPEKVGAGRPLEVPLTRAEFCGLLYAAALG